MNSSRESSIINMDCPSHYSSAVNSELKAKSKFKTIESVRVFRENRAISLLLNVHIRCILSFILR